MFSIFTESCLDVMVIIFMAYEKNIDLFHKKAKCLLGKGIVSKSLFHGLTDKIATKANAFWFRRIIHD